MNTSVLLRAQPCAADMAHGHVSSVALYRLTNEAIVKLAHAVFPDDWHDKVLFITDISLRFVRAVECVEETLTITADCTQNEDLKHDIAQFCGEIRLAEQRLAVRFKGKIALR